MKKQVSKILAIVLVMIVAFAITACGGSSNQNGGSGNANAGTSDGKVYNLSFSTFQPATSPNTICIKENLDELMAASNGRLNITLYDSGTLLAAPDVFKGIQDKLADMAFLPGGFAYDYLTISGRMFYLPFFGLDDIHQANDIYKQIREEFPEVDQEFEEVGLKNLGGFFTTNIDLYFHDASDIATTFDELKGKKIGSCDAPSTELLKNAQATPVNTTNAEMYTSLDNGVYSGILTQPSVLSVAGCGDTINGIVEIGEGGAMRQISLFIMNNDSYNALPADLQALIDEYMTKLVDDFAEITISQGEGFKQSLIDNGATVVRWSDDEVAKFAACAEDIQKQCISEIEAKGLPGQAIFDRVKELEETKN